MCTSRSKVDHWLRRFCNEQGRAHRRPHGQVGHRSSAGDRRRGERRRHHRACRPQGRQRHHHRLRRLRAAPPCRPRCAQPAHRRDGQGQADVGSGIPAGRSVQGGCVWRTASPGGRTCREAWRNCGTGSQGRRQEGASRRPRPRHAAKKARRRQEGSAPRRPPRKKAPAKKAAGCQEGPPPRRPRRAKKARRQEGSAAKKAPRQEGSGCQEGRGARRLRPPRRPPPRLRPRRLRAKKAPAKKRPQVEQLDRNQFRYKTRRGSSAIHGVSACAG